MNKFSLFCFTLILLLFSSFLWAQTPSKVQHQLGLTLGMGVSGEAGIEYYSSDNLYTPNVSTAFELSYQTLLLNQHLHLGVGLGYQSKAATTVYNYKGLMDIIGPTSSSYQQIALTLPIELGYRLKIAPKHALIADALVIPFWAVSSTILHDSGDSPATIYQYNGGLNLDLGLQLGYQLQLTERLSGQVAVRGTVSPFPSTTHNDPTTVSVEYYAVRLNLGLQYRLGAL